MKTFLTFLCCFFTVAFSLPAQTLLEGYVRDMECGDFIPRRPIRQACSFWRMCLGISF